MAHDLSYDEVIIDYSLLIEAMSMGVSLAADACDTALREYHNTWWKDRTHTDKAGDAAFAAEHLYNAAQKLQVLSRNYSVLLDGLDRHKKSFINDMAETPKFPDSRKES